MQLYGPNECAEIRVEYGGTLGKKSWDGPRPEPLDGAFSSPADREAVKARLGKLLFLCATGVTFVTDD